MVDAHPSPLELHALITPPERLNMTHSGSRGSPIRDTLYRRLQPSRHLHDCSGCFRLERSPGGPCTHWKSAALPRRTPTTDIGNSAPHLNKCQSGKFQCATKHATLNFTQAVQQFYAELWLARLEIAFLSPATWRTDAALDNLVAAMTDVWARLHLRKAA